MRWEDCQSSARHVPRPCQCKRICWKMKSMGAELQKCSSEQNKRFVSEANPFLQILRLFDSFSLWVTWKEDTQVVLSGVVLCFSAGILRVHALPCCLQTRGHPLGECGRHAGSSGGQLGGCPVPARGHSEPRAAGKKKFGSALSCWLFAKLFLHRRRTRPRQRTFTSARASTRVRQGFCPR